MNTLTTLLICTACWMSGQENSSGQVEPAKKPAAVHTQPDKSLADAERIARLQRSIEKDQKELETLKTRIDDPASEFYKAQNEFQRLETELEDRRQKLQELVDTANTEDASLVQHQIDILAKKRQLALERFNLAIQERKNFQQKISALAERIEQAQHTFDQLTGKMPEPPPAGPSEKRPAAEKTDNQSPDDKRPTPTSAEPPSPAANMAGMLTGQESSDSGAKPSESGLIKKREESKELQKAKKDAQAKEVAAEQAVGVVQSLNDRLETLRKNIKIDQDLLATARQKVDNVQRTLEALQRQEHRILLSGSDQQKEEFLQRMREERERYEVARLDVRHITNHLNQLQEELTTLQAEQIDALREANRKRQEAEYARQLVADLSNPFSPQNMLQWLLNNGPKILVIFVGMLALHRLVRVVCQRIVEILPHSRFGKRERELENRAQTLAGVIRNVSSMVIWGGGTLMLLDTIYVPVIPLLGGAAVIGLAVAFGAQNLIRDYFTGFMILVEDQYAVNDVVRIGTIAGQVERISLRTTVVRDLEGILHFIPHGTITTVSNMTHGWSRALFNIGIAYNEKPDRVMEVLKQIGREIRRDPDFGPMILDDLEMQGVDNFAESSVTIRFFIKTRPLKQWNVKREFLRRVKNRFDEVGIEFPFPTRTVYHRNSDTDADAADDLHELAKTA